MSADNWGICPNCKKAIKPEKSKYGKVSEDEYLKEIAKPVKELEETLREDYECSIDENGRFHIFYRAGCQVCGFGKKFEIDEQLKL
jgi:hypothetical protein